MSTSSAPWGGGTPPLALRAHAPGVLREPPALLGLAWRSLGPPDLQALADLVARIEDYDNPPYRTTREEAAEYLEGAGRDPRRNSLGGFDHAGVLRAYGFVRQPLGDERTVRAFLEGGVDPLWRRRGIGTALLAWQTARARQVLASTGKEVPGRIATFVDDGLVDKAAIVRAAGFEPRRFYTDMRRDLRVPIPEVGLRDGLVLVPWASELDDQVRLAHNDAFADHWGSEPHSPASWAEGRTYFAQEWSFVVLDRSNDRSPVAGYLLSSRYEQDWPSLGYTEGYIDLLGVRRAWRGKRVATALLTRAMRAYAEDGIEYAGLGVDTDNPSGAFGIYSALGFEPTHGSAMYSLEL
jgi:ribosomal protein S18 acetylase RimI-like enzyme